MSNNMDLTGLLLEFRAQLLLELARVDSEKSVRTFGEIGDFGRIEPPQGFLKQLMLCKQVQLPDRFVMRDAIAKLVNCSSRGRM